MWSIYLDTLMRLVRDNLLLPLSLGAMLLVISGFFLGNFTIENGQVVYFNLAHFSVNIFGGLAAILWSQRAVEECRTEGMMSLQLVSPLSRSSWYLAKLFALKTSLVLLGTALTFIWGGGMSLGFGVTASWTQLASLLILMGSWLILCSMSFVLALFCSASTALFSSISLWIVGMLSQPVYSLLSPNDIGVSASIVRGVTKAWNLQIFNISNQLSHELNQPALAEAISLAVYYCLLWVAGLSTLACFVLSRKDL